MLSGQNQCIILILKRMDSESSSKQHLNINFFDDPSVPQNFPQYSNNSTDPNSQIQPQIEKQQKIEQKTKQKKKRKVSSRRHNQPKALFRKLIKFMKPYVLKLNQYDLIFNSYLKNPSFKKLKNLFFGFEGGDKNKYKTERQIGKMLKEKLISKEQNLYNSIRDQQIKERAREFISFLKKGIIKLKYKPSKKETPFSNLYYLKRNSGKETEICLPVFRFKQSKLENTKKISKRRIFKNK